MTPHTPQRYDTDPLSVYYEERAKQGKTHTFWLGKVNTATDQVAWQEIDHRHHDGIGALMTALAEHTGEDIPSPVMKKPQSPPKERIPSLVQEAVARKQQWRVQWALPSTESGDTSGEITWHLLPPRTQKALEERSRRTSVSLNSTLLATLTQTIGKQLVASGSDFFWGIPVNMRGAIELPHPTQNHFSFISLRTHAKDTVSTIHQSIKQQLDDGEHWAYWHMFNYMAKHPEALAKSVSELGDECRVGTFSNLGEWSVDGHEAGWVFVPPTNQECPIATGVVNVNGQLGLAIHAHPCLGLNHRQVQELMSDWVDALSK